MSEIIQESDFFLYWGEDGKVHAQVILGDETVWMSQKTMGQIFDVQSNTITYHIGEIYSSGELNENSTTRKIRVVQKEGNRDVNREVDFYNLDMIIAVGYRVNSYKATRFRQWATRILKEYLIKGFALDDERLKQGNKLFGRDYFRELLERIREIRASEKLFYEKIKEFYSTSIDYDPTDPKTHKFFAHAQDKLEYAVIGKTSAEIIKTRADALQPNMGLKTFKNIKRDGNITKCDVTVAKNYLTKEELTNLNLVVTMFLDYIENYVNRVNKPMKMIDYSDRLNAFLSFNEYPVLDGYGKIARPFAEKFAEGEYEKFKNLRLAKPNQEFQNSLISIVKTGEIPTEANHLKAPLSSFNGKLNQALNYNPKADKEPKKNEPKKKRGRPKKDKGEG